MSDLNPSDPQVPAGLRGPAISGGGLLQMSPLGIGGFAAAPLLAACGTSTPVSSAGGGKKGGDLVIVRAQDSVDMDKTMVFSNASIWTYQQMFECLVAMT